MITQVYGKGGPGAIHRFDPRAKMLLLLVFLILFFLPIRVRHLGVYLAVVTVLSAVFIGTANTLRPLRLIAPILVLVMLLTPPFYREGSVLIALRGFTIVSVPGLLLAIRLMIRFTGITMIFYLFIGTTDPDALILAFRWFRLPFTISLVLSIALEYIPTIRTIYDQVQDAHRLRLAGEADIAKGLIKRLIAAIPVLTSVLILSVRRIPTLAMALECRGVGRKNRRSSYRTLKTGPALLGDALIAIGMAAVLTTSVVLFP
ncbi:MAG: energy-coupling factor transporter transmembrane protein EcfT [Spirochaetaceae bacterium]|nr:MAG: energy-coupling factor transporter transmembrane protein EcfT [Spirochaetaceae bacterium]